ncbi:hypothetical protein QYF36_006363 [Acer negundo]|nr:hypothetical protein QYF36_006363 [Acer negundo]
MSFIKQKIEAELSGFFEGLSLAWRAGFRVQHVFRKGNRLADGLAHLGQGKEYVIHIFNKPPPEIASVFEAEISVLVCSRLCAI